VGSDIATGGRWRQGAGVCNVKCANKNGRCCANVGGRGVVTPKRAFAGQLLCGQRRLHERPMCQRRTGAVARQ
jgi:hypothetical protein